MEREPLREEEQKQEEQRAGGMPIDDEERRESGMPGGGAGRRDEPGHTGVYPASSAEGAAGDAPLVGEEEWGQGERGAEGYEDSGSSELNFEMERELGLLQEDREDSIIEEGAP
jgi:hypothetical protein